MSETVTTETTATTTATDAPKPSAPEVKTFTQEQLDAIVAERLRRAEEKATREREAAEAAAREAALAEQGQYKPLAEQRAERIVELEGRAAQVDTVTAERDELAELVQAWVEDELKTAPDYVRDAISDRTPQAQLKFIRDNREKWAGTQAGEANAATRRSIPPTPRGASPATREEAVQAAEEALWKRRRGGR